MRGGLPNRWDAAAAAAVTAATVAPLAVTGQPRWWLLALGLAASVPVAWRGRALLAVCLVVGPATTVLALCPGLGPLFVPYGALLCAYTFAAHGTRRLQPVAIAICAAGVLITLVVPRESFDTVRVVVTEYVAVFAIGGGIRARRDREAADAERAQRTAEARAAAVQLERVRIARDMHDIVTHSVGLMIVQAEAGPVVARTDPARAEAVFDTIAATGREAVDQLRVMLGALRGQAGREPVPGIDAVGELVARTGRGELRTSLTEEGERRPLPVDVGVAAYRIVQESLTNVVRHAGARSVEVTLSWTDASLEVRIADDGGGTGLSGPPREGHGLLGMRERAQACGGTLAVDPRGFTVTASLPAPGRPAEHWPRPRSAPAGG
ncbi:sensor histidine kinase [Frankia sp. AgB1.9]|uniref:sensor histidine kinase n=1 Tax=unclassified Frankia TaxID=2632575 RepID=UPI001933557C|nr:MULTISPECIES: sensor histidine kinase [unclassified Frankia]MBL7493498.1 sensor histidine kinase [Frankia sp. AgW1.1]MBL7548812.1 sensor histidine kinase [Frankia sp. AgB1.9]MBL7621967.1 sensor histidine kinase [Frankia sp. AgB1.8]